MPPPPPLTGRITSGGCGGVPSDRGQFDPLEATEWGLSPMLSLAKAGARAAAAASPSMVRGPPPWQLQMLFRRREGTDPHGRPCMLHFLVHDACASGRQRVG